MKTLAISIVLFLSACSSGMIVRSDYDRDISIKSLTTYMWTDSDAGQNLNPLYYNELNDKRIKKAVDQKMAAKGYTLVSSDAELTLHYHLVIESKTELRSDPYGYYGPYWLRPRINSYQYNEGTLIIDVIEGKSKSLAWRGWATSIIDADRNIKEELINEAVDGIFKAYPHKVVSKN
jgi:hypothetical protein